MTSRRSSTRSGSAGPRSTATATPSTSSSRRFGGGGAIRAVQVHKRRVRYKVNGCTSEVTDVVADGKPSKTIAIESEDKAAVLEAVRQTGLSGYLNTSYPKGLVRRSSRIVRSATR